MTPAACGPLLDSLPAADRGELAVRLRHLREALTGYASGTPAAAGPGEPRPEYDPSLPLLDRYQAKAAELGVSSADGAAVGGGAAGLRPGRDRRRPQPAGRRPAGRGRRALAGMCRLVLAEHTEASRPTKELVLRPGLGPAGRRARRGHRARAGTAPRSRGAGGADPRHATRSPGSTKGKRSIAARPQGVYGRLRPTRPGEYLLLDTTPLDVFAMEPVTLRWVRCELTIAMDLYSRAITGLRLSPVSTKSVDAALVLFEALRPGSRQHTSGGLLPYAGLPDLVVAGDGTAGLAGVAAETVVVDHGKIYLSDHLLSVCQRLGISVQPARPLTPTDKAAVERFFRTLSEGLLAALPGYKGPDVYSRGADPEGCAYFFTNELEQVVREWISGIYHRRVTCRAGRPGGARPGPVPGGDARPRDRARRAAEDPGAPGDGVRLPAGRLAHHPALRRRGRRAALQRPGADPLPEQDQPLHRRARREMAGPLRHRRRLAGLLPGPGRQRLARAGLGARAGGRRAVLGRRRWPTRAAWRWPRAGTSRGGGRWQRCWSGGTPAWSATRPSGGWRSALPSSGPPAWAPGRGRPRRSRPCRQSPP